MRNAWIIVAILAGTAGVGAGCDVAIEAGAPADGTLEATALLRFVDYRGTTARVLEVEGGVSSASASRIVSYRNGADGVPATKDDEVFGSVDELATVSGLSGTSLMRLGQWAVTRGWDDGDDAWVGVYDGVGFSLSDAEATLEVANTAPESVLDIEAGLRSDAVASILAARPILSVEQLASLPRVGEVNLAQLRGYAVARAEAAQILAE